MNTELRELTIVRTETSDQGTFGTLIDEDGFHIAYTGELPMYGGKADVQNEQSVDCIPCGRYTCVWAYSPRFKRDTYRLTYVPKRSGILIHSGNYCGNKKKGYLCHVEGCILLGKRRGILNDQQAVLESRSAVIEFESMMDKKEFALIIKNNF